jgi:PKD repeat protein
MLSLIFTSAWAAAARIGPLRRERPRAAGLCAGVRRTLRPAGAVALLCLCAAASPPSPASAAPGQIEAWGTPGSGPGQLNNPAECALFGADPVDGSVFVGDVSEDQQSCRIQKLSPSGEFEGATTVPRFGAPPLKPPLGYRGIAVDHSRGRLYLLESSAKGANLTAQQVRVYSTVPNGAGQLVPASPATLPLPSGAEALRNPTSIAVDPSDGDLVILAEEAEKHAVVQRVGADGAPGPRFVDLEDLLRPTARGAKAIAVGPDGTTYALTGNSAQVGAESTRAWELPPSLASVGEVPGFAAAATDEGWESGLLKDAASSAVGGPQIAISPDGETLYWKENRESSSPEKPGEVLIRGYSLSKGATRILYGGHPYEEGRGLCAIGTGPAPLAAVGAKLIVFDHAFPPSGEPEGYGPPRVLTFGPGGGGCTVSVAAKLEIDGTVGEPVTVRKGVDVVDFDASQSELGGQVAKVVWDFGDGEVEEVPGPDPALTTTHRYLKTGSFAPSVTIQLAGSGSPSAEASGSVEVGAASPQAFLEVLEPAGFTVPAGSIAVFDASQSWDPTGVPAGKKCTQALGCPGSSQMASYTWSFDDGSPSVVTAVPTVSHRFEDPESAPVERLVTLTVESEEGETDSDSRLITVQGMPAIGPPAPGEVPPLPSDAAPAPAPSGGGKAAPGGRRHRAVARCRRLKKERKRRRCMRAAQARPGRAS